MGHIGDKILAHLFHAYFRGHVADEQQPIAIAEAGDFHPVPGAAIPTHGVLQRLTVVAAIEVTQELRVAQQVHEALPAIGLAQPQQPLCRFVEPLQAAVVVDDGHAVAHGGEGVLQVIHRGLQAGAVLPSPFLQLIDLAEQVAPDAVDLRWRLAGIAQPLLHAIHLVKPEQYQAGQGTGNRDQRPPVVPAHAGAGCQQCADTDCS